MPAINGLSVRLKHFEQDKGVDVPLMVCFASVRKHPELQQHINTIRKLQRLEARLFREYMRLVTAKMPDEDATELPELTPEEEQALEKAQINHENAVAKRLAAVTDFYVEGMKGAGYTESDIEGYLPDFNPDQYEQLINRVQAGCGRVDFFQAESQPEQS